MGARLPEAEVALGAARGQEATRRLLRDGRNRADPEIAGGRRSARLKEGDLEDNSGPGTRVRRAGSNPSDDYGTRARTKCSGVSFG